MQRPVFIFSHLVFKGDRNNLSGIDIYNIRCLACGIAKRENTAAVVGSTYKRLGIFIIKFCARKPIRLRISSMFAQRRECLTCVILPSIIWRTRVIKSVVVNSAAVKTCQIARIQSLHLSFVYGCVTISIGVIVPFCDIRYDVYQIRIVFSCADRYILCGFLKSAVSASRRIYIIFVIIIIISVYKQTRSDRSAANVIRKAVACDHWVIAWKIETQSRRSSQKCKSSISYFFYVAYIKRRCRNVVESSVAYYTHRVVGNRRMQCPAVKERHLTYIISQFYSALHTCNNATVYCVVACRRAIHRHVASKLRL